MIYSSIEKSYTADSPTADKIFPGLLCKIQREKSMGKLKIETCGNIEGLYLIQPKVAEDARGYFVETYNYRDFKEAGLDMVFVQDNQSGSSKGVLRGLHYQKKHTQGKLVRVLHGEVYDVAVDIRKGSKTYGQWYGVTLSAEKKNMFYIPEGFAHGFYVLSDTAEFSYKCTDFYDPSSEAGIFWNDAAIGVKWPIPENETPLISEKDKLLPNFSEDIAL